MHNVFLNFPSTTQPKNNMLRIVKKIAPIVILTLLTIVIFHHHILGENLWIGNSDRLNSHLKILKFHAEGIAEGHINAWNDYEMMGYDTFVLPYTFPNPLTYISQWFGVENLYTTAGYISLLLLTLAGIATYYCIFSLIPLMEISLIGAICYQFSTLSILKASQNDMSFAVFIVIPLMILLIHQFNRRNVALSFFLFSVLTFLMLNCMFLQKASYALILIGSYLLYRSVVYRDWYPTIIFGGAFFTGLIGAFPRIYGIFQAMSQYSRNHPTLDLSNFEVSYKFHNIYPSDILRWFDDKLFHFYSTEGFLLYTSVFIPFLLLYGFFFYSGSWGKLPFSKKYNAGFFFWFLISMILVALVAPVQNIIFLLYQKMDFTHARILIAALLPMVILISLILFDIRPCEIHKQLKSKKNIMFTSAVLSLIVLGVIEFFASRISGFLMFHLFSFEKIAIIRICVSMTIFLIILSVLINKKINFFIRIFFYYLLYFLIFFQTLYNVYTQVNKESNFYLSDSFAFGGFYYAKPNEFQIPSRFVMRTLEHSLENSSYRAALLCDPFKTGGYCAGHIPEFWRLRVIDGYYGIGVPARIAALPWPQNRGLRTISFEKREEIPWRILSILNVKYALVVNPVIYRNPDNLALKIKNLIILKNPNIVAPRVFFTSKIVPVPSIETAVNYLFQKNQLLDLTRRSVVEGVVSEQQFDTKGTIILQGHGDYLEINMTPSSHNRFLVLNELYFPGWQASINGKNIPIYPTNVVARGVFVPAGTNNISFRYTPFVRSTAAFYFYGASMFLLCVGIFLLTKISKNHKL